MNPCDPEMPINETTQLLASIRVGAVILFALAACSCVTTGGGWKEDRRIPFSPDDKAIAYRHKDGVYVARSQGDEHRRIYTAQEGAVVSAPRWAPGQRAVAFAVSDGEIDETGRLPYTIWVWPAPETLWESTREGVGADTATLPSSWTPPEPIQVVEGHVLHDVQIRAGAVFEWHPDGQRILFLDADNPDGHSLLSVDAETGERTLASPVHALSLAFSISPDGNRLLCATDDPAPERSGLWLGPIGAERDTGKWIEADAGPRVVPSLELDASQSAAEKRGLLDLRPRLGAWSSDSRWLVHLRVEEREEANATRNSRTRDRRHTLVISSASSGEPLQLIPLGEGIPSDLHWSMDGVRVGLLADQELVVANASTGETVRLAGVQHVEAFIGWSGTGDHLAYLTPADQLSPARIMLPSGHTVIWGPAERHNLVVAAGDGTTPESRFNRMNIIAARWAHTKPKLSFWATYLPTVTNLPPGDPAAVLDIEDDTIKWFPTNVNEYAQVGHYYLLNRRYEEAVNFYSDALEKLVEVGEDEALAAQINLWRGISRLNLGQNREAAEDLSAFREGVASIVALEPRGVRGMNGPVADAATERKLDADRILLSTMLSMDQVQLAAEEARRIVQMSEGIRRVQAHGFLGLIEQATGDTDQFARRMVQDILPGVMSFGRTTPEQVARVVKTNVELLTSEEFQKRSSPRTRLRMGQSLEMLSDSVRSAHPEAARTLALAAAMFYRKSGDVGRELHALRFLSGTDE